MLHAHDVTRRTVLRSAAIGTIALASGIHSAFAQTVSRPPNIVFIMADDPGYAEALDSAIRLLDQPSVLQSFGDILETGRVSEGKNQWLEQLNWR